MRGLLLQHLQEARLRSQRLQDSLKAGAHVARANKLDDKAAFVNRKVKNATQEYNARAGLSTIISNLMWQRNPRGVSDAGFW